MPCSINIENVENDSSNALLHDLNNARVKHMTEKELRKKKETSLMKLAVQYNTKNVEMKEKDRQINQLIKKRKALEKRLKSSEARLDALVSMVRITSSNEKLKEAIVDALNETNYVRREMADSGGFMKDREHIYCGERRGWAADRNNGYTSRCGLFTGTVWTLIMAILIYYLISLLPLLFYRHQSHKFRLLSHGTDDFYAMF